MRWLSASRSSSSRSPCCRALTTPAGVFPTLLARFSSAPQRCRSSTPVTLERLQARCSGVWSRRVRAWTLAPPSNRARIVPVDAIQRLTATWSGVKHESSVVFTSTSAPAPNSTHTASPLSRTGPSTNAA
ncbi:unnamed protein product [Ectocarpus sp. 12 AP-2014]